MQNGHVHIAARLCRLWSAAVASFSQRCISACWRSVSCWSLKVFLPRKNGLMAFNVHHSLACPNGHHIAHLARWLVIQFTQMFPVCWFCLSQVWIDPHVAKLLAKHCRRSILRLKSSKRRRLSTGWSHVPMCHSQRVSGNDGAYFQCSTALFHGSLSDGLATEWKTKGETYASRTYDLHCNYITISSLALLNCFSSSFAWPCQRWQRWQ